MKKFWILILLAVLLTGCALQEPEPTQPPTVTVGAHTYPADAARLDLREQALTVAEYEQLQMLLPQCEILWKLPFQGLRVGLETRQLRVDAVTLDSVAGLAYLKQLESLHISTCPERSVLEALAAVVPDCRVSYDVTLAGRKLRWDEREVSLTNGDLPEAREKLDFLPKLKRVIVTDTVTDVETLLALKEAWPEIEFRYTFPFFGQEVSWDAREVEVKQVSIGSVEEVERLLPLFSGLEKLALLETGLPSEELDALWKRHPETRLVWTIRMGYAHVRTDVTTMMPFKYGYDGLDPNTRLGDKQMEGFKYLVDVICLDLGHQGMTNVEFVRYMPKLQYLIIGDARVPDLSPLEGLKELKFLEAFLCGVEDLSPLAGCTSLLDVNLCYNNFTDITPLLGLEKLENIWLSGNSWRIPKEQQQLLAETFPNAKIVYYSESSTGDGWRNIPRYYEQRDLLGMGYMIG